MVNVTFSLPEDTVKRLRKAALARGKRKGAISELVDAAIQERLGAVEAATAGEKFQAMKDGKELASASSLRALAAELKRLKVDPREVEILSSTPLEPLVRTGLRGHSN